MWDRSRCLWTHPLIILDTVSLTFGSKNVTSDFNTSKTGVLGYALRCLWTRPLIILDFVEHSFGKVPHTGTSVDEG